MTKSGELLDGAGLDYVWDTRTITWDYGLLTTITGSFIDHQDQITASYVVKCENQDRAYEIAKKMLGFHVTVIKVWRIHT